MQQIQLPPLAEGETYIGAIGDKHGNLKHVVLLAATSESATWQAQMDWAKSIGGDLPDRVEQAMLFKHHRDLFEKRAYWSNETHEDDSGYAWYQYFDNGYQYNNSKGAALRARAVRRLPI